MDKYNGWTNWETWVTHLHFDGFFDHDARNILAMAEDENEAISLLESLIEEMVTEMVEETAVLSEPTLVTEFVTHCLHAVNFWEIADAYIDDAIGETIDD